MKVPVDNTQLVEPNDWTDTSSVGFYIFAALAQKDTTNLNISINQRNGKTPEELYLSQMVKVIKFGSDSAVPSVAKPVFPVRGVRILFSQDGANSRMALPTTFVNELVRRFEICHMSIDNPPVKDQIIKTFNGVSYTIFPVYLSKTKSYWIRDGEQLEFKPSTFFRQHSKDLIASVGFKLCLKYKGRLLADRSRAAMSIAFEPSFIYATDIASEALYPDPPPTNPVPAVSHLSQEVTASPYAARVLSQLTQ